MLVRALVEYEVVGDSTNLFYEEFCTSFRDKSNAIGQWELRFVLHLLKRGIVCSRIKVIGVEYVGD